MSKYIRNVLVLFGLCANMGSFAMDVPKPPKKRKNINIEFPEEIRKSSRKGAGFNVKETTGIAALNTLRRKKVWRKLHEQMRNSKSDSELSVADELNNLFEKAQSQSGEVNKPLLPDMALPIGNSDSDSFAPLFELANKVVENDDEQIHHQFIAQDDGTLEVTEKNGSSSSNSNILKMLGKIAAFATTENANLIVTADDKNHVILWKKLTQSYWVPVSQGNALCEERICVVYRPIELGILENPIADLSIHPNGLHIIAKHEDKGSRKTTVWQLKKFPYFEYQRTDIN